MTESTPTVWQAKPAAMRDLILLALHQRGGVILDGSTGRVASRIREYYSIPDSKATGTCISNVLHQLTLEGVITRRMNDAGTRTYDISLVTPLTDEEATLLAAARADNLARFTASTPRTAPEQLIHDCSVAYAALQKLARSPEQRVDVHGNVALNVTGVIQSVGVPRSASRAIKYYLREMGLARALSAVDNNPHSQLWWWRVSDQPLDTNRLRELASGDKSYEAKCAEKSGTPKAGPVTVTRVEASAPALVNPTPVASTPLHESVPAAQPDETDPVEALVAIAEDLERENTRLTGENAGLHQQLTTQQTDRESEAEGLKARIRELEEALGSRRQTSDHVRKLIDRLGGKRTPTS